MVSGVAPPTPGREQYRFSVDQYLAMAERGVLDPDTRTELVDGIVVKISPPNGPHIYCKNHLQRLFTLHLDWGQAALISQDPVRLTDDYAPQPDVALVRRLGAAIPAGADLLLAIEVSDTTLGHDLEEKRRRYAAAGVPAYWVADVVGRTLHLFAEPRDADYHRHEVVTDLDVVVALPHCAAGAAFRPREIFLEGTPV
jgi:Uma2 family endonuclease